MNDSGNAYRIIRVARLLRPMIDAALLIAAVGLFLHFQNLSQEHQRTPLFSQAIQKRITHAPMAYVEQVHDSEIAMWQSFSSWFHNSDSSKGNCRFESQPTADSQQFYMLCIGHLIKEPRKEQILSTEPEMPLNHVFSTLAPTKKSATTKSPTHSPNDNKAEAQVVIQGWVETSEGRLHFDSVKQRWTK